MLDSIKAKAKAGADAAERSAKATKLKADIMLIENKLKTVKMEFGKDVYPAMAAGDRNTTETLFMTTKAKVEGMEAEIAAKRSEIERLKTPSGGGDGVGPSMGAPPGGGGVPPPAGPPPGAPPPAGLPEGWKKATTPEGKDYFYHEPTGQTSWSAPTA